MRLVLLMLVFGVTLNVWAYENLDRQQIEKRIQPVGKVHIEGENVATRPQTKVITSEPGQEVYEKHCIVCHKNGIAGAPKFRDSSEWGPRLKKRTLDDLVKSAIEGMNAMPPKGTCSECSNDDIKAAIEYMLPKKL